MADERNRIAVIGGGPAGMMAAGTARSYGAEVVLFDHSGRLGKKLAITGKGRCNLTNHCPLPEFLENVTANPHFLYSALNALSPEDTMAFFEGLGVPLKTERGNRVYPQSDKASSIVEAMKNYIEGVPVRFSHVRALKKEEGGISVVTDRGDERFDAVILATGGKSYPLTGSDGSGYALASRLGHSVTELIPSLVPIECKGGICGEMMGLSLRNVAIKVLRADGKTVYEDFGEMLFTHFGVSGPVILSASARLRGYDLSELTLSIDLKPALDEKTLDARLLSDFRAEKNRDFINSLGALLPAKMIPVFARMTGVDPRKKVNAITKEERRAILRTLKDFRVMLLRFRPIEEAIVTSGGVRVTEVNPKNMSSKLVEGLYFAGEILDLDAYTGGFNLQIAFSTGFLAGRSAALQEKG